MFLKEDSELENGSGKAGNKKRAVAELDKN